MQNNLQPNHFANLFGGVVVEEAIKRAEGWNLKSRVCHPLDRPTRASSKLAADLAKFDASVDSDDDSSDEGQE